MTVRVSTLLVWLLCSAGTTHAIADGTQEPAIIPTPARMELSGGTFNVQNDTLVVIDDDVRVTQIAHYFGDLLEQTRRLRPGIVQEKNAGTLKKVIRFTLRKTEMTADRESYRLEITSKGIELAASHADGLFYGATTLWQTLSADTQSTDSIRVPALVIEDAPRLKWRALMLDSVHQYQSPEFIKRFIDAMALHKLNVLHWYLADDEAWRIEITKYPKLAAREFYTQQQVNEIVAYAAQRNVTIVPGLALPAHAGAMIAAYPQLGAATGTAHLLNADDSTFAFIGAVMSELSALFPGKYIHIGSGDYPTSEWSGSTRVRARMRELGLINEEQLQRHFLQRLVALGREHGRQVIGWDLPLSTIDSNSLAMSARGLDGALSASGAGLSVVVGSSSQLDFDHPQGLSDGSDEPAGAGDFVRLEDLYRFDPAPVALGAEDVRKLTGVQSNVWTHLARSEVDVAILTFPRAAALGEIAWSPYSRQRWGDFVNRLAPCVQRYKALGIAHSDAAFRVSFALRQTERTGPVRLELSQQISAGDIRYTLDDSEPTAKSLMYRDILSMRPPIVVRAATFLNGQKISNTSRMELAKEVLASTSTRN